MKNGKQWIAEYIRLFLAVSLLLVVIAIVLSTILLILGY